MKKLLVCSIVMLFAFTLTSCGECEHQYEDGVITKEATCTEKGEKTYTCTLCEETKVESIPVVDHTYKEEITKEPTFDKEGEKTFIVVIPIRKLFLYEMMWL